MNDEQKLSGNNVDRTKPVRTKHQMAPRSNSQQHISEDTKRTSDETFIEKPIERSDRSLNSYGIKRVDTEQFRYTENVSHKCDTEPRQEKENTAFRLRIISDDCDNQPFNVDIEQPRDKFVSASRREDIAQRSIHSDDESGCNKYKPRNIAAEKPVVRNFQRQLSNESRDSNRKSRGKPGRRTDNNNDNKMPLNCREEIQISSAKINMLIINKFQAKTNSQTVDVEFKEGEGKVIMKGNSEEDIREAKLKMHECLEQLVYVSEAFPRQKCEFLAREESRRCIRTRSIKQKIKAAFDIDVSKSVVRSYAFSKDEAEKGLQFLKDEIIVSKVNLRPGQEQVVSSNEWTLFVQGLDTKFTTIYVDESSKDVVIESFMEMRPKDIFKKVVQYLKQNVPKKISEVILESAKARCFRSCFEDSLRRNVQLV